MVDLNGIFGEDIDPKADNKKPKPDSLSLADLGLDEIDEKDIIHQDSADEHIKTRRKIPILEDPIDEDDEVMYKGFGSKDGIIEALEDEDEEQDMQEDFDPSDGVMSQEELASIMASTMSPNSDSDDYEEEQAHEKPVKEKKKKKEKKPLFVKKEKVNKEVVEKPAKTANSKGLSFGKKFTNWFKFHFTLTNMLLIIILVLGMYIAITKASNAEQVVSNISSPVANQSAYLDNIGEQSAVMLSTPSNEMKYVGWQVKNNNIYFYYDSNGERFFAPYNGLTNEVGDLKMTLSVAEVKKGKTTETSEDKSFSEKDPEWKKAEEIIQSISGKGSADKTVLFSDKAIRVLNKYKESDAMLKIVSVKGSETNIKIEFSKEGLLNAYGRIDAFIGEDGKISDLVVY